MTCLHRECVIEAPLLEESARQIGNIVVVENNSFQIISAMNALSANEVRPSNVKVTNGCEFPTSSAFNFCRSEDDMLQRTSTDVAILKLSTAWTREFGRECMGRA